MNKRREQKNIKKKMKSKIEIIEYFKLLKKNLFSSGEKLYPSAEDLIEYSMNEMRNEILKYIEKYYYNEYGYKSIIKEVKNIEIK